MSHDGFAVEFNAIAAETTEADVLIRGREESAHAVFFLAAMGH